MILENQVSSPFAAKVRQIASRLGVPPDYLMAVMWSESRLDPAATNPEGGATGLIQFMPATAAGLGTSCEALREMSALDQLDYVERFFRPYAPRCHTFGDFYMACFFPAAIGKEDDYVLQTRKLSAERIARQNPAFDTDRDGRITAGEFRDRMPKHAESTAPDSHPHGQRLDRPVARGNGKVAERRTDPELGNRPNRLLPSSRQPQRQRLAARREKRDDDPPERTAPTATEPDDRTGNGA